MAYPDIRHHGAANGVTGSCHQLLIDTQHSLLIDCGLFQGAETSGDGNGTAEQQRIDFDLAGIKALIATHVHIDHIGRLPYLMAAGFKGPILCSEPSAKLLPLVLEDAFRLGISLWLDANPRPWQFPCHHQAARLPAVNCCKPLQTMRTQHA